MKPLEDLSKQERKVLKAQAKAIKAQSKAIQNLETNSLSDITVLCVRFGNKYNIEYVEKLRNMVSRNLTIKYEFVCLTDDPTPIKNVRLIVQKNAGYSRGWWHKLHMFDPYLPILGRILYFDLDVVICNNIDKLAKYEIDKFVGIRDFNRKFHPNWNSLNSSILAWNHRSQRSIWEKFKENPATAMRLHGDQDWIWRLSKDNIVFFPDEWIQSYKWEIRKRDELTMIKGKRNFKNWNNNLIISPACSVAVFHGDPNPSDIKDKFVLDNWQ